MTDRVSIHVNDWCGGTNAGWWEWTHDYGEGKVLKSGDRIASTIRLKLGAFPAQRQ